ncbi:PAS domain-containing protein [uncultured Draconibacterium sp.]|uniref:PAS domain-containing protein n=1 Tax=uncultured Draconibacterium sp. TaxID=1573823 RepID=UPI0025FF118B|nr:PAS domain-containing protein [uncultured Draconibacterium sp.]
MPEFTQNGILQTIAESIPGNVAIIKPDGDICNVNQDWITFGNNNGINTEINWHTYNYYNICKKAAEEGSQTAEDVLQGIRNLLNRIISSVFFEYPCHSPIKKRWFELHAKLIKIENKTFVCLIHQEVTEKIKAQKKLIESQKMFRIISENAPYGVGLSQGNISHYANAKLLSYLEYENFQDYTNTPLLETVHPEDRNIITEKLKLIAEKKISFPFNVKARFLTAKGRPRFFSVDVHQVCINNEDFNLVNVVDETDKINLERSEKQLVIDAMYLNRKQEILESFSQFIEDIRLKYSFSEEDLSRFSEIKSQFKFQANDWNLMKTHFRLIHKDFFQILSDRFPELTQHDLNFCAMLKLNFTTKEVARYLNIKVSSVQRRKVRLKKKLNLSMEENLIAFVQSI